ncbi:MAG: hypothetical protein HY900_38275 [Deltaproteobacteria bacterium]|nr:hypothetical protein [Deltaproteobacteria bacterium]
MASAATLLLYVSFPLLCVLAVPPFSRRGGLAERVVFGVALYEGVLLVVGVVLGLSRHLTPGAYLALMLSATGVLAWQALRNGPRPDLGRCVRWCRTRRGTAALLAALLVGLALALELGFDALYGTRHGDGLWYHIPRAMFWTGQHSFDAWPTPAFAQIGLPVAGDLIVLHKMLLGEGWAGIGYVTLVLSVGAAACVYVAALDLRVPRWHAALSALLFLTFPTVGLRIWSVNTDIAAAFPALASYVALRRIREPKVALSAFLVLNGMALACKPTVAPVVLVLGCFGLWHGRRKLAALRDLALPCLAAASAGAVMLASYWPVYAAFGDFMGGQYSRAHQVTTAAGFFQAVAMHSVHWLLEPLGYLTRFRHAWELEAVKAVYNVAGAGFERLPDVWKPYPGQDLGRTGLATVLALPFLLAGLPRKARLEATLFVLLAYVPLSGMIASQPFFARYNVIVPAGFAVLWGGTRLFRRRGRRRWLFAVVALNAAALFGVVSIDVYLDRTNWAKPGGLYHYVSDADRELVARTLSGRPLLVLTEGELEALLVGPEVAFPIRYLICPTDGDWDRELRAASSRSEWLAFVHAGRDSLTPGPEWSRPGVHACGQTSRAVLERALWKVGWTRYRSGDKVDLWRAIGG